MGIGVALNVMSALYGCESYVVGDIRARASYRTARITATCWDVFGRKHASIFDYVQHTTR